MFFEIVKLLYNISFLIILLTILLEVCKKKYLILVSLVFWFSFFYFCYIAFPCFFIEDINLRWNFSDATLNNTRIIVAIYNIIFSFYLYKFSIIDKSLKNEVCLTQRYDIVYQVAKILELLGCLIILVAIFKLMNARNNATGIRAYFIIREAGKDLEAKYHLRLLLYLLLSSSFYLYSRRRKVIFFTPLILIILFETLAGERTTAFIVLLYIYIIYAVLKRTLALKLIIPLVFLLLIGVLFSRASALNVKLDLNIIFGEFFETFTTLPYLIEHSLFGFGFNFERILSDYTYVSFIPGTIKENLVTYLSVGGEMAEIIGRGYGLGSNFIFEQLFEFGAIGFLTSLIIPLLLIIFDRRLKGWNNLLINILFVFQLRLYVREGISQFMIIFYIFIMYFAFFYFMHKKSHIIPIIKKQNKLIKLLKFDE